MSKPAFTPGPWSLSEKYHSVNVRAVDGPYVADCNASAAIGWETKQANAHLIAAAPDMYEALRTTSANIRSLGPAGALDDVPMPYREWLEVVEDALSKAEGRS